VSRDTENALLLLAGLSIGIITVTGAFTHYVKPSLLPWLAASAVLIILLALVAIVRGFRHGSPVDSFDGHTHRSATAWLLIVPIIVLAFIVPPPIGPRSAGATVVEVSTDVLRQPYPPLPAERAPTVPLSNVVSRATWDTAGTLDGRLITVKGFTLKEDNHVDLAQVVMLCCAADARVVRLRLGGPAASQAASFPDQTWLGVEGIVHPGEKDASGRRTHILAVSKVTRIDPPDNPYGL
jgi:uncharacterized repeat protein (TIGR03943 family)